MTMKYGYQKTIKLLYHVGFWDGPISGVCEIEDKKFWFEQINGEQGELWVKHIDEEFDTSDEDSYSYDITRFYRIYKLPEDVMNDITSNHEAFREHVGHHTDYVNNKRTVGMHHGTNWYNYKSKYKPVEVNPYLIDSNCIGWFDSNSI